MLSTRKLCQVEYIFYFIVTTCLLLVRILSQFELCLDYHHHIKMTRVGLSSRINRSYAADQRYLELGTMTGKLVGVYSSLTGM